MRDEKRADAGTVGAGPELRDGGSRLSQEFSGRRSLRTKCRALQRNANGFDDVAQDGFGGLGFFLQRSVARTGDNAMRKDGDGELFEIVGDAIVAAVEKSAGLRGALQHQSAARADAERKLLAVARAMHDFERVVVQAGIDFNLRDWCCIARTS